MVADLRDVPGFAAFVQRVVTEARSTDDLVRQKLDRDLAAAARRMEPAAYGRGAIDSLLAVVQAIRSTSQGPGLAPQMASLEPGSLPTRMLLEIAAGVRGANADLAERLDTDPWQLSRAGRRLRELGLASRTRSGRLNEWSLTGAGERVAAELSGSTA